MKAEINQTSLNGVRVFLAGVSKSGPKIMSRTLNKTAEKGRTEGSKGIRKQVNLSAEYVRDRMKVNKASQNRLQASISTPKRGMLLSYYLYGVTGVSQKGNPTRGALLKYKKGFFSVANLDQPLKVKIKPKRPPQTLGPKWFILPKLKNSNLPGLAKRVNGKLKLHGPSLSQVFTDVKEDIAPSLLEYQAEQLSKQIDTVFRGY
jgi:hypothetical protein